MKVDATRIQQVRRLEGLTQEEFADKVGVTRVTVSMWETGVSTPRPYWLRRLAKLGGVDVAWFYAEEEAA